MPSDLAKKKAAKARQRTKKTDDVNEETEQPETQQNGAVSNGKRNPHHTETGLCRCLYIRIPGLVLYHMCLIYPKVYN